MNCQIQNATIYYETCGEGKPIVMLHGCSPDHRLMMGCMEPVFTSRSGYQRIYPDLPGMGKSDAPGWIDSTDHMLEAVLEFIRKIIPHGNFLIAGESYGGCLSRGILYKMQNRVDGLLLICPVTVADSRNRTLPQHPEVIRDEDFLAGLSPKEAEDFCSMAVMQNRPSYDRYKKEIDCGLKLANEAFIEKLKRKYAFSFDVDNPRKAKYGKPVLLIAGRQDSCVGYHDLWNIVENYPHATFAVLDRAGHNLQIEQAGLLNSLVNDWLDRTETAPC